VTLRGGAPFPLTFRTGWPTKKPLGGRMVLVHRHPRLGEEEDSCLRGWWGG